MSILWRFFNVRKSWSWIVPFQGHLAFLSNNQSKWICNFFRGPPAPISVGGRGVYRPSSIIIINSSHIYLSTCSRHNLLSCIHHRGVMPVNSFVYASSPNVCLSGQGEGGLDFSLEICCRNLTLVLKTPIINQCNRSIAWKNVLEHDAIVMVSATSHDSWCTEKGWC